MCALQKSSDIISTFFDCKLIAALFTNQIILSGQKWGLETKKDPFVCLTWCSLIRSFEWAIFCVDELQPNLRIRRPKIGSSSLTIPRFHRSLPTQYINFSKAFGKIHQTIHKIRRGSFCFSSLFHWDKICWYLKCYLKIPPLWESATGPHLAPTRNEAVVPIVSVF